MKKTQLIIVLIVLMLFSGCQSKDINKDNELVKIFGKLEEKNTAISMVQQFSQDYYAVLDKRRKSMEYNFEWYKEYTKNNIYPYPYDEGLGITEIEYDNLMNGKYISLVEDKNIVFECQKEDPSTYKIAIKSDTPLEFNIDLSKNIINMPSGKILEFSKKVIPNREKHSLVDEWEGYTYTFLSSDMDRDSLKEYNIHDDTYNIGYENIIPELLDEKLKGELISITIGKFVDKEEYLIYYREIDVAGQRGNTYYNLYYIK